MMNTLKYIVFFISASFQLNANSQLKNTFLLIFIFYAISLRAQFAPIEYVPFSWDAINGLPCEVNDYKEWNGAIYAASECGLYRTYDTGEIWERVMGVPAVPVKQIVTYNNIMLVKTIEQYETISGKLLNHKIYRSNNDANSFNNVFSYGQTLACLCPHGISTGLAGKIYVREDGIFFMQTTVAQFNIGNSTIYTNNYSEDGGITWQHSSVSFPGVPFSITNYVKPTLLVFANDTTIAFRASKMLVFGNNDFSDTLKIFNSYAYDEDRMVYRNGKLYVVKPDGKINATTDLGDTWESDDLMIENIKSFIFDNGHYFILTYEGEVFRSEGGETTNFISIINFKPVLNFGIFEDGWFANHDNINYRSLDEGLNWELNYLIRFQNTGTDTAFRVVVRDTISPLLDLLSLRTVDACHPYTLEIGEGGVAKWYFENILLPDSSTNEAASHGFIQFNIDMAAGLFEGTIIENEAAIYFDFNPAIIANNSSLEIIYPVDSTFIFLTLCEGDILNNGPIFIDTVFTVILPGTLGDSVIIYNIEVLPLAMSELNSTLCIGETVVINGTIYDELNPSGTETFINGSANGCDSIVHINLSFYPNIETVNFLGLEAGMEFNGVPVFSDTTFIENLIAANGCDSMITTHISVLTSSNDIFINKLDLIIYPNPASGNFYAEFNLPEAMELEIYISDLFGRKISSNSENKLFHRGKHVFSINFSDKNEALYIFHILSKNGLISRKIIKQK